MMMDGMHRDLDFNLSIVIQFEGYFGVNLSPRDAPLPNEDHFSL